jgi:hypothetical protein
MGRLPDKIGDWSPARLQQFIVNNILIDPAVIPKAKEGTDYVPFLLAQPQLVGLYSPYDSAPTITPNGVWTDIGNFSSVGGHHFRFNIPPQLPGKNRQYRLGWGFTFNANGTAASNIEFRVKGAPSLTSGQINTGTSDFQSATTTNWYTSLPDNAGGTSNLVQMEVLGNAAGGSPNWKLSWFQVDSRYTVDTAGLPG